MARPSTAQTSRGLMYRGHRSLPDDSLITQQGVGTMRPERPGHHVRWSAMTEESPMVGPRGRTTQDPAAPAEQSVRQLRVIVAVEDFDTAIAFYRDAVGLPELAAFEGAGAARVVILEAGRATLELANQAQVAMIDKTEVGRQVSPHIRLAFEVRDAAGMTSRLSAAGATVIAEPTVTPWRSLNARLDAPAGIQLTLFEELAPDT